MLYVFVPVPRRARTKTASGPCLGACAPRMTYGEAGKVRRDADQVVRKGMMYTMHSRRLAVVPTPAFIYRGRSGHAPAPSRTFGFRARYYGIDTICTAVPADPSDVFTCTTTGPGRLDVLVRCRPLSPGAYRQIVICQCISKTPDADQSILSDRTTSSVSPTKGK